jgi:dTDP-4-dehydrorhamnose 3,5-epimerase
MNVLPTELEGVLIVEPKVFGDKRGFFLETFQKQRYRDAGIDDEFVQDNISFSVNRTLRGLHYQHPCGQAKLVQVLDGEIYDVAVDIRLGSPTFGRWTGVILSAENRRQFYLPQGFAHGFCVMSETALFMYKCSDYYTPRYEGGICWNDPDLAVSWPVQAPILSERDAAFPCLREIDPIQLPEY